MATKPLLVTADVGANTTIFANGLALQNPTLAPAIDAEINLQHQTAEHAFDILAQLDGV